MRGIGWAAVAARGFCGLLAGCKMGAADAPEGGIDTVRLVNAGEDPANWITHGGSYAEQRFSPLDQIDARSTEIEKRCEPSTDATETAREQTRARRGVPARGAACGTASAPIRASRAASMRPHAGVPPGARSRGATGRSAPGER